MEGFPCAWQKDGWGQWGGSPWFSLLLWVGGAVRVSPLHGVELRGVPPHRQVLPPHAALAVRREGRASPGLLSRNGFSRGGAGREGPFPEPLGQTHCLPGRQQQWQSHAATPEMGPVADPDLPLQAQRAPACSPEHCRRAHTCEVLGRRTGAGDGGAWGDALAPAEPGGPSWALRRGDGEGHAWLQWSSLLPISGLCSLSLSPSLLVSGRSILPCAGVQSWCGAEAGRGRVNPARHNQGKEGPFPFCCAHILQPGAAWDAPAAPRALQQQHCAGEG